MHVKSVGIRKYITDNTIMSTGHTTICLPPYNPDLNTIELVCSDVKCQVTDCLSESLEDKRDLSKLLFSEFSVGKCSNCCKHVYKIKDYYCLKDTIIK